MPEEHEAALLAAYDEALAAGLPPTLDKQTLAALAPIGGDGLREDLAWLRLLDRRWPRCLTSRADTVPERQAAPGRPARLGRFRVLCELGRGGQGVVFLAFDPALGRQVALKVPRPEALLNPDLRQRFLREAHAAAGLDHPNLVPVYEAGEDGPVCYIASAYCPGRSLAAWLKDQPGPMDPRAAAQLVATAAEAVHHMHSRGVLHRDLKPANILLQEAGPESQVDEAAPPPGSSPATSTRHPLQPRWPGVPKITDFGLAKQVDAMANPDQTHTGAVLGTPAYMAPEQAAGRSRDISTATDVYALGTILYECLTGRPPFGGDSERPLLERVLSEEPPPPRRLRPGLPRDLETVCLKCLDKDPRRRYASALALAEDLDAWLGNCPIAARTATARERLAMWVRRRPALAALFLLSAVSLLSLLALGSWYARDQAIREAETLARSAYLEREVAAAATEAENRRQELHRCLQDDREAAQLQSDPKQWQRLLESAQAAYKRADVLAGGDRGMLSPALGERLGTLASQLEVDEQDRRLALALDRIRLESSMLVSGQERLVPAAPNLARAFRDAGYDLGQDSPDALAARIRQSAIRLPLVAALDFWALSVEDPEFRGKLLRMARAADPDPWRDRFRQVEVWRDLKQLRALAAEVDCGRQTPQLLLALERCLSSQGGDATGLIRRALIQHPQDFWLYFALGMTSKNHAEKAGAFRAALAVRPEAAVAHYNLGVIQQAERYADEAIACYQKAIDLQPKQSNAFNNLGLLWDERNKLAEAIACYRKAIDNDPKCVTALVNLGSALQAQGNLPEAVSYYERALEIEPNNGAALNNLGTALRLQHKLDEAVVRFQKAIQIDPNHALAWCNLAHVLRQQGKFKQALPAMRRGHELGSRQSGWSYPSGDWVLETERWIALDEKLAALTRGEAVPGSAGEQLALAEFCTMVKKRYATAARFYAGAFAAEPKLAEQLSAAYRYNAACAAARAASGEGKDAAGLDEPQRRRWRTQALEWLTAELAAWTTHFEKNPQIGPSLVKTLRQWQADTDLARVRDEPALVSLPVQEQSAWRQFWARVAALTACGEKQLPDLRSSAHK